MKKRVFLVCIVFLFFSVFVLGEESSNDRTIGIIGCTDFDPDFSEAEQDVHFAKVGNCLLPDKREFCASNDNLQNVFTTPNACSLGLSTLPLRGGTDPNLANICCPLEQYTCSDDASPGEFLCVSRTTICIDYDDEAECLVNQCYWDNTTSECFSPGNSCDSYSSQAACESDFQGLAFSDANCRADEYEGAGVYLTVPRESCECVWDATFGCGVRYNATNVYGSDTSKHSLCTFFTEVDDCIDGFENYRHIAIYDENNILVSGLLSADVGCANRTGKRRCGEAIIKVPFFNFINIIFVILIIALIYFSLTKFSVLKK